MSNIEDFVSVTVTRETKSLTQKGFSTPLIVSYHTNYLDRARKYTDADDLLDEGFSDTSKAYRDALALQAQGVREFVVGRRANADTQLVHIIPDDLTQGLLVWVKVDGIRYEYTIPASATIASVSAGLVALLGGGAVPGVTVSDATTHVLATASSPGDVHTYEVSKGLKLLDTTLDSGIVADLAAIYEENSEWYGLALDNYSAAIISAAAVWIESKSIVCGLQSADWTVKNGEAGNIAELLKSASYTRSWGTWHHVLGGSFAAAKVGRVLRENPGKETPAHITLNTQNASNLTANESSQIQSNNWGIYVSTAGISHIFEGKTPSSEFIDQVIGSDWIKFRMQERVFGAFINNPKIPQTELGLAIIEDAVWSVLKLAATPDFPILDGESTTVEMPELEDIPLADRQARVLSGVSWRGKFTGAFHKAKPISGIASVA